MSEDIQFYILNKLTHQVHTSERKAFRACRRRWNWVYREMYYPVVTPAPLEFGVAFHRGMEVYYEPMMWNAAPGVRRDLALVAFRRECEAQMRRYKKLVPDPDVTILEDYKSRIELGLGMLKHYCNKVSPEYDSDFTPVRVEVPFEVPISYPETGKQVWCQCPRCWNKYRIATKMDAVPKGEINWKGLPVTYAGRLDMLAQDNLGRYWIFDWKTTARMLDEDAEASFLQLDDQITSYVWALNELGVPVAGFIYVEIKKAYPKTPRVLEKKYKGRLLSTDRQTLTTPELFLEAAHHYDDEGLQLGVYDDYLMWLKSDGPRFTQRHQIHRNKYEIQNAGANIAHEAIDILNNPRIYPQPGRFSCNWCLFKQPCIGMNMGEDYQYTLDSMFEVKKHHYYEEELPSTE